MRKILFILAALVGFGAFGQTNIPTRIMLADTNGAVKMPTNITRIRIGGTDYTNLLGFGLSITNGQLSVDTTQLPSGGGSGVVTSVTDDFEIDGGELALTNALGTGPLVRQSAASGVGTVTSVGASTTVSGLGFSVTSPTTTPSLSLTGVVAVASGGTGGTDAATARSNLGVLSSRWLTGFGSPSDYSEGIGTYYVNLETYQVWEQTGVSTFETIPFFVMGEGVYSYLDLPNTFANTNTFAGPVVLLSGISGNGTLLTNLNGTEIRSGTVAAARLDPAMATEAEVAATYAPLASPPLTGSPTVGGTNLMNYVAGHLTEAEASLLYHRTNATLTRVAGIGAGTTGDLLYRDANGWTNLAKGTQGQFLAATATVPAWSNVVASGSGDFVGPSSSTSNAVVVFNGTTGKLGKEVPVLIDGSGNVTGVASLTLAGLARTNWTGRMEDFEPIVADLVAGRAMTGANIAWPNWHGAAISGGTLAASLDASNHIGQVQFASTTTANSGYSFMSELAMWAMPGLAFEDITKSTSTNAGTRASFGFHDSSTASDPVDALRILQTNNFFIPEVRVNSSITQGYQYPIEKDVYYRKLVQVTATNNCFFSVYNSDTGVELFSTNINVGLPIGTSRVFGSGIHTIHTNSLTVQLLTIDKMKLSFNGTLVR